MSLAITERIRGVLTGSLGEVDLRVAYSDESENEQLSVIVAIVMNMDEHWADVEAGLAAIKTDTPDNLLERGEFKGRLMYQAVRQCEWLRANNKAPDSNLEKARSILSRILAVTIECPTPICYRAVDRIGWNNYANYRGGFLFRRNMPETTSHDAAFDDCLARVDAFANTMLPKKEQILWIHDHRGGSEQERQTKTGLRWAQFLTREGWDPVNLKFSGKQEPVRIADSIYFGHSHESLALQLADVCCSTISLHLLQTFYGDKHKYAEPFYAIIQRRVVNDGVPPRYMNWAKR
jgi:hypothetical protein